MFADIPGQKLILKMAESNGITSKGTLNIRVNFSLAVEHCEKENAQLSRVANRVPEFHFPVEIGNTAEHKGN